MTPLLGLLNIGTTELIIVVVVAVMLFGGDLPDVARKAARMVGKVRGMADDLGRELRQADIKRSVDLSQEVRDIDAAVRQAGTSATPPTGHPEPGRDAFADDPHASTADIMEAHDAADRELAARSAPDGGDLPAPHPGMGRPEDPTAQAPTTDAAPDEEIAEASSEVTPDGDEGPRPT